MDQEAENQDVNEQEVVLPEAQEESNSQEKAPETKEDTKEYNWRRMEKKVIDLERKNQELNSAVSQIQSAPKQEPDELEQLQEDDLITVGQFNKLAEKRAQEIVNQELAKREKAQLPNDTKAKFKDYDEIVTTENIELLIKEDPDLEYDIQVSKNPYARAYKAIKQASFFKQKAENKESSEKIEENIKKPISSNSIGKQRPLSHANAYAKGDPSLFEEMQQYRGGSL